MSDFNRALPGSEAAERSLLGVLIKQPTFFAETMAVLNLSDLCIEKHRRIYTRMCEIHRRGDEVNLLSVAEELNRYNELESVDGLSYLAEIATMPDLSSVSSYLKIIRDKSVYRKLVFLGNKLQTKGLMAEEEHSLVIEQARGELMEIYENSGRKESAETVYEIVAEAGGVDEFFKPSHGIATAWEKFDFYTGGWQSGDLSVIAARPSMGKTAFALNALWHAADREGKRAVFYSLEMHRQAIVIRLISLLTGIPFLNIKQGHLSSEERRICRASLDRIENSRLRIVQLPARSMMALRAHAERLHNRGEIDIAAADYLGLMKCANENKLSRTQELGEVSRGCKSLAMDFGIPFLLLAQLNRLVESRPDKRPNMADIRDSGEVEESADLITFLHRPGYYKREDPSLENIAEIIFGKNRNGDTPIVELEFNRRCGKFYESGATRNDG